MINPNPRPVTRKQSSPWRRATNTSIAVTAAVSASATTCWVDHSSIVATMVALGPLSRADSASRDTQKSAGARDGQRLPYEAAATSRACDYRPCLVAKATVLELRLIGSSRAHA